jgi:hypothetical protein
VQTYALDRAANGLELVHLLLYLNLLLFLEYDVRQ